VLDPERLRLADDPAPDRLVELLRDGIRYGHTQRGLPAALTDESRAAVERNAGAFTTADTRTTP
jgi:hypothetical protein